MVSSVRATFGWIGQVLSWLVILSVVVVLAAAVVVPRFAGATPYTVLTGSMQPTYPPGTLVVVKPVPFKEIGIGKVITYQLESGEATVVTHRVVGDATRFDGTRLLVTQGDANNTPDRKRVEEVQVKGELWYSVPYLGHVNSALSGNQRQWAVLAVSGLLVGYAAFMFVGALRDRRREKKKPAESLMPETDPTDSLDTPAAPITTSLATTRTPEARTSDHRTAWVVGAAATLVITALLIHFRRQSRSKIS